MKAYFYRTYLILPLAFTVSASFSRNYIEPDMNSGQSGKNLAMPTSALEPFSKENDLFVFSTDFSYYQNSLNEFQPDFFMDAAITSNSPEKFLKASALDNFSLSARDKSALLKIARNTLIEYLNTGKIPEIGETPLPENLLVKTGAFVTLTKKGVLKGCIGNMKSDVPLYQLIQSMVIASATRDHRFSAVRKKDLPDIEIEISVLTPMKRIHSIDEIIMGKDGIYLKKGKHTGTFLPKVAMVTKWTREEFLGHCARDKAGIGWNGWEKAEIYTYEAIVFKEGEC